MKINKIKNKLLYQVGVFIILLELGYVFFAGRKESVLEFTDYLLLIFLSGAGFCAAARAFYFDRHLRIIQNRPIVDFGLFLNNIKFEFLVVIYFFIKPVIGKREELFLEKNRVKINICAISAYIFIIAFIVLLIFKY